MKSEKVEGIGSIQGGEYQTISIDGIGKLKGPVTARQITVNGMFKSKGKITADEMRIDGIARIFRDIKVKSVKIDGILKMRRASLNADKIVCDGIMTSNREVCADEIYVDGICSVSKMYGDSIVLKNNYDKIKSMRNPIPIRLRPFLKLYFGRDISVEHSFVDVLECTNLEAEGLKAKVVRANNVKLKGNCIVDRLYCDGQIIIDDTCKVNNIFSNNQKITLKKEMTDMANATLVKILDLYKHGKIDADEAEKMINSIRDNLRIEDGSRKGDFTDLPWEDDGKLRIVAFIGRKLLKKGDPDSTSIEVKYDGEALDIECHGNLSCSDVKGNVSAKGNVTCRNVGGNVNAGGNATCENIEGNVSAGGNIHCKNINGSVAAGGGIHIEK
ncbi:hypothetical protein JOD02_000937 [Caldicoprobacter guelmensis]|uniref:hypothetical protein n=1 Tax=Caldicoprobacter guelmensis TaxID=1170224 RepID=UPI001959CC52|nr:hypothetical protein [Caldicoprobacter guelmensis]MBM7582080.1 hypothetical protein [Caldicoprobacter guelmensis]